LAILPSPLVLSFAPAVASKRCCLVSLLYMESRCYAKHVCTAWYTSYTGLHVEHLFMINALLMIN
jgi:hypothetical protein